MIVPTSAEQARTALIGMDLTRASQPWGPIPGVVAIHGEPSDSSDEPGRRRVLENSDGSTLLETIEAIDPPRTLDDTITELTNAFRHLTSRARSESGDGHEIRITWHSTRAARNATLLTLVWLVVHLAFRPRMCRMHERIGSSAAP
jgi:hypothetical protein